MQYIIIVSAIHSLGLLALANITTLFSNGKDGMEAVVSENVMVLHSACLISTSVGNIAFLFFSQITSPYVGSSCYYKGFVSFVFFFLYGYPLGPAPWSFLCG